MHSRRDFLQRAVAFANLGWVKSLSFVPARGASVPSVPDAPGVAGSLFPGSLPPFQWREFSAAGYSVPVTGIVYRNQPGGGYGAEPVPRPVSGMPLGGIDTGGLYLEGSGLFGYSSIFNHYVPPGGPLNMPYLGIGVGGRVWLMTTGSTKNYAGRNGPSLGPPLQTYVCANGGHQADSIDYWGHYPIVDMQYKTGAPVSVGMRAWSPFIPGDSKTSNTPGAVFEIHLENSKSTRQTGTLAFSFPGFCDHRSRNEVIGWIDLATKPVLPKPQIERHAAPEGLSGTWVEDKGWGMSYVVAAINEESVRVGGGLATDGWRWVGIEKELPAISEDSDDGSSSLAIDFSLEPAQKKVIRLILAWYAPEWEGNGNPGTGGRPLSKEHFPNLGVVRTTTGKRFRHMYAARFANAGEVATYLSKNHRSLLQRIIGWQSVLYSDKSIPGWLADSLTNAFYYFAPCSVWAQARAPIGDWCKPEDGVFGLSEAPRACPHMSTFTNLAIAGPTLSMFFPDLALSSLRAFRSAQNADGDLPQLLGLWMDVAVPMGYGYQEVMMGGNYMHQLYWQWKSTGNDEVVEEFYPSVKRMLEYNFNLNPDLGPSQIISMPAPSSKWDQLEWFEDRDMFGYQTHVGGYRLAAAEMMREWAVKTGDTEYAKKLEAMIAAGKEAMQKYLWKGDHYLLYYDPKTGKKLDAFFSPQLNGQYYARIAGVPGVFPTENIEKVLEVMREKVCKISRWGLPPDYSNPDGTVWTGPTNPYLTGKYIYMNYQVFWIAVLAMYEGQKDFGLDLLHKNLELGYCHWGYMWDGVNDCSAQGDTGEMSYGWDYWYNWSVWTAAAALANGDFSSLLKPGGLVNTMIKAGASA